MIKAHNGLDAVGGLSSPQRAASAVTQNAFYDCVSAKARAEIPKGSRVYLSVDPRSIDGVGLLDAMVGWATIAPDAQSASHVLGYSPADAAKQGEACGSVVVTNTGGGQS